MKDCLAELKRFATPGASAPAPTADSAGGGADGSNMEMARLEEGKGGPLKPPEGLAEFYQEVETVKRSLRELETKVTSIDEKMAATLAAVGADKAEALSKELDVLMRESNALAQDVSKRVKLLQESNRQLEKTAGKVIGGNAEMRLRESMQAALARKFYELMAQYQDLKARHAARYRDRVRQHVEIASGEPPTEDQVDAILEGGDPNRLFATKILQDRRQQDAANALIFIKERHNDILRLEQSINELHQIFLDMALLVEQQGEMLDQIEFSVGKSTAYTEAAVKELVQANRYAKRKRKKICIIVALIACCILIPIVAIIIWLAISGRFSGK